MDSKENRYEKTTIFGEGKCFSEDKQVQEKGYSIQYGMVSSSPSSTSFDSTDNPSPLVSIATNNSSRTTDRQNKNLETYKKSEKMKETMDDRMKYNGKLNVKDEVPLSVNNRAFNVGFGSNNIDCGTQENEDWTRLDSDTVRQFNEIYTTIKASRVPEDQDTQRDAPVEQRTAEIVGKSLKSACATVEYSANIREKTKNDHICTKGLGHCNGNESSTRTPEVLVDEVQCNTGTNSSLANPLKDSNGAAPTSSHANPCSGFSEIVTAKPVFLGPLVSRDGSLYYIPVQSPNLNTSPNSPVFRAGNNLYANVVAPNAGNPNSTASIPAFPANCSTFNLPLYTNCAQLSTALTTNMISVKSLQRACSYMMAPTDFNPDSIASIPSNQPATTTSSVIVLESLRQALSGIMASNGNNPNSIASIPVNQSSNLSTSCTTAKMSLEEAERDSALQENQDSKVSVDDNTHDRVPISSEISHQSPNLDIISAAIPEANHEVNAHKIQDSELSTVQNTNEDVVRMSLELSQLFTKEDTTSQVELESSPHKTQDPNASIPLCDTSEDQEGESCGYSQFPTRDIESDTISETEQESCCSNENTIEPCDPEGRKEEEIDDLLHPPPPVQQAYSQLSKNDSIASSSRSPLLSQDKHTIHKTSTLIRVSPRYSATKGRCSPLVRVSKNVSPLKPIRGHTQHYVITHGHDKRWTTGRPLGGETADRGNVRKPIYLRGTPPQGYKRRLLKTAAKTTARINKGERKKKSSMEAVLEDVISEQTTKNNTTDEGQESNALVKGFEDKIPIEISALSDQDISLSVATPYESNIIFSSKMPKELCIPSGQDTQNPNTPSRTCLSNDSRAIMKEQTPQKYCTPNDQDTHSKTPCKIYLSKGARNIVGDQAPNESCTQNDQDTHSKTPAPIVHKTSIAVQTDLCIPTSQCQIPNNRASPRTSSKSTDQNIPIQDRTPETSAQTPNNEKEPHDFLTREAKVFKTPRNEDRERKREREHRNCLELRDSFQQLRHLLPGTRSSWSRVKLLNLAVEYIQQMQETLKDFESKPSAEPGELSEEEELTANVYVVENLDEQDLVENPIYVLYPTFTSNTDEVGVLESFKPTDEAIEYPMYNRIPMSVDEQCMDDECTAVDSRNLYANRERDIAVNNIERYRLYENQIRIAPGIRYLSERRNTPEEREEPDAERRFAPEDIAISEAEERVVYERNERNDAAVEQIQLKISGVKAQSAIEVEVVAEGSAFGYNEEERQCLFDNFSSSSRGLLGQVSPNVLYTTSPSLAEIISSPIILIPGEHAQSTTEPKKDIDDQELPRSPQYGDYGYSNATKNLNPFVVPQSPESLSVILGGTSGPLQIEDFSQSSNSQDSQNTSHGLILEDALNYVGATVSPFSTPRLDFLPSFTELSPSQVIPDHISNEDPDDNPVGVPDVVTDFSDVGLITVAASVEVHAGSIEEMPQRKPRKKKVAPLTHRGDRATKSSNKPRKNYKVKSLPKRKIGDNSMQDCTSYLDSSPKQTRNILKDYNTLKTPSPRIREKNRKSTNDKETSEAIDNELDTVVPLCPLPKKRGRKPKNSQKAECKRQLIDVSDGDLSNVPPVNLRVTSDGPAKRGRKRKRNSPNPFEIERDAKT